MKSKAMIRQQFKTLRHRLNPMDRSIANETVQKRAIDFLAKHPEWKHIGLYANTPDEAATNEIINWALQNGKTVYLPCIVHEPLTKTLTFYEITQNWEMACHPDPETGIMEPDKKNGKPLEKPLDVVIMPVVGFDQNLTRIGSGEGFYDRWLGDLKVSPLRMGLAYQLQFSPFRLRPEKHDQPMDMLISDWKIYYNPSGPFWKLIS